MGRGTPCEECLKPILEPENEEVWELFECLKSQVRMGAMGGFMGFDYTGLELLLRARQIPECQWRFILDKLSALAMIAARHWNSDKDKEQA